MFKFNFNPEDGEENRTGSEQAMDDPAYPTGSPDKCKIHEPTRFPEDLLKPDSISTLDLENGHSLKFVKMAKAIEQMPTKPKYLEEDSDLLKNVYEGGMKIWECSIDLVNYLHSNDNDKDHELIRDKHVLELGCGAGVPGLYCASLGEARAVDLTDFNAEVIDFVTMPNFKVNNVLNRGRFYSGDWSDFLALKQSENSSKQYDLILTSETIYNEENYAKLLAIFECLLAESGKVLLAAKTHYFGVGGGIRRFESVLQDSNKWCFKTVFAHDDGVKREIIEITRKT